MDLADRVDGYDLSDFLRDAMVDGHKKTLDLMKDGEKNLKDADLKAFAAKTAPTVQMHLDAIKRIKDGMK